MTGTFTSSEGSHPGAFGPLEWALVAVPALIWGTSFLLIAIALDDLAPGLIAFGRIATGAAVLACMPAARGPIAREDRRRVALLGFFWMALPFTLFPIAQQWIDSSLAGMLNGATPLFTAVIAAGMLRRPPGAAQVAGLVVGFVGVLAVMWPTIDGGGSPLGAFLVLVASASYGLALNLLVPVQQRYGSVRVFFWTQIAGLVLTAPLAAASLSRSSFSWSAVLAVLALGAGATAFAFIAMGNLTGRVGATRASITVYLIPVVAVAVGVAFHDEHIAAASLVGVVIVLLGAWLVSRRESRAPAAADVAPEG